MTRLTFPETDRERGNRLLQIVESVDSALHHPPGHSARIADRCESVARLLGLSERSIVDLKIAALARGLGLYELKLSALDRDGPLTLFERAELWRHPIVCERQLALRDGSKLSRLIVRWHHEWWNGLGYPDHIAGQAIPVEARILRTVETYETLLVDRPYRAAVQPDEARSAVSRFAGIAFDPAVADALLTLVAESDRIETPDAPAPEVSEAGA